MGRDGRVRGRGPASRVQGPVTQTGKEAEVRTVKQWELGKTLEQAHQASPTHTGHP